MKRLAPVEVIVKAMSDRNSPASRHLAALIGTFAVREVISVRADCLVAPHPCRIPREGVLVEPLRESVEVFEDQPVGGACPAVHAMLDDDRVFVLYCALNRSDHDGEQEGVWQIYRGLMAFYRN